MLRIHFADADYFGGSIVCDTLTMLEGGADFFTDAYPNATTDISEVSYIEAFDPNADTKGRWFFYAYCRDRSKNVYKTFKASSLKQAREVATSMYDAIADTPMYECGFGYGREDANLLSESGGGVEFMDRFYINWSKEGGASW